MQQRHFAILPIILAVGYVLFKMVFTPTFVNPETGSRHKVGLQPQEEEQLGLQSYEQVLGQESANVITEGPEVETVKNVARKLAAATRQNLRWQVSVIRSQEVNAFCLPGGEIVVYTGILPVAQNEAGLATVLGHEMAHATSHHGAQRIYKQQQEQALLTGVQGSLYNVDPGQQQTVMAMLGAGTKYFHALPFNREQESEADHIGLRYMARAGFDPHEALSFWQRMDAQSGGGAPPQFASDHPSNGVRIQQIQQWMPEAEKEYAGSR